MAACRQCCLSMIERLCDGGADVNRADGQTPLTRLTFAARNGHCEVVKYLCEHGADINHVDTNNWTPLAYAALNGHCGVVRYLCEHGANINHTDKYDWFRTPRTQSAHHEVVIYNSRPLTYSARNGHYDVVKYLCERGANGEQYALDLACSRIGRYMSRRLLDNLNIIETLVVSAVSEVVSSHSSDPLTGLLQAGKKYAPRMNQDERDKFCHCVLLLMSAGAPVSQRDHELIEALHPAVLPRAILEYTKDMCVRPRPLKHLCKFAIRGMVHKPLPDNLALTGLPKRLQEFVQLKVTE